MALRGPCARVPAPRRGWHIHLFYVAVCFAAGLGGKGGWEAARPRPPCEPPVPEPGGAGAPPTGLQAQGTLRSGRTRVGREKPVRPGLRDFGVTSPASGGGEALREDALGCDGDGRAHPGGSQRRDPELPDGSHPGPEAPAAHEPLVTPKPAAALAGPWGPVTVVGDKKARPLGCSRQGPMVGSSDPGRSLRLREADRAHQS